MSEYTQDELDSLIRDVDTELGKLLLSSKTGGPSLRTPLDYRIAEKAVTLSSRVKALQEWRAILVKAKTEVAGGAKAIVTVPDYEIDRFGLQLGQTQKGTD